MKIKTEEKVPVVEFMKKIQTQNLKNHEFITQLGNVIYIHGNGDIDVTQTIRSHDRISMEKTMELTEDTPISGLVMCIYHESFKTTDAFVFESKKTIRDILDVHDDAPDARCLSISYRDEVIWTHYDGMRKDGEIHLKK